MKSLVRLVKQADWQAIVLKAIEQAKRGDKTARQWLADYIVGKPVQGVELDADGVVRFIVEYEDGLPDKTTETP